MTSPVSMPAGHAIVATDLDAYEALTAAWVSWSPTLSGLTLGNGTTTAVCRQVGKTVDYRWRFILGTTSAVGTDPAFTLPATPHADYVNASFNGLPVGSVYISDFGTGVWVGLAMCFSGSTASLRYSNEAGSGSVAAINATTPITFTTSDALFVYGTYEAA